MYFAPPNLKTWLRAWTHACTARKLVIGRSRSLFLQLWPALFHGWMHFPSLLFRSRNSGCALFEAHTFWARLLIFKETCVETVFAVVNCAVLGLSVFDSLVLTWSLIILQLCLLGRSVECILHLRFKFKVNTITY